MYCLTTSSKCLRRTVHQYRNILQSSSLPTLSRNATTGTTKKVKDTTSADQRYQLIQDILYDKNVPTTPARPIPAPSVHSFTHAVATHPSNPEAVKQDTIERAWALHKEREAVAKVAEVRAIYESMRAAMEELEKVDKRLFEAAKVGTDPEEVTVFPRRLRVPTETPPVDGWDYEMKTGTQNI
ncbi:mitochondrial ribosomal protein L28-domain-containing protein [Phlyctochytrium arcticum]|nr:mitochondrial ribosomal protein L28-domain-containing protein [Phlyctochytrium arcticum]